MKPRISFSRGPMMTLFMMIFAGLLGAALVTQLFNGIWLIGVFGLLILMLAFCFSGIEFDVAAKKYREYYRFIFFKLGSWKSYEEFKFVSVQGVRLVGGMNLPDFSINKEAPGRSQSAKIMLLNQLHNKKLLVLYSRRPEEIKAVVEELTAELGLPYANYNPPVSEATQRRRRNRGR